MSEAWPQEAGTTIGQKAIVSYGGLDLHGRQRSPVMALLSATVEVGGTTINVNQDVDWQVSQNGGCQK